MRALNVYLIRHGETAWNEQGRIQGTNDIPLNGRGLEQAGRLTLAMKTRPVSVVFSSPLLRAWQTAQAIRRLQGVPLLVIPQLREMHYGEWEGRTTRELLDMYGDMLPCWRRDPLHVCPPGGETYEEGKARSFAAWARIRRYLERAPKEEDIAVAAHGQILLHLFAHMLKREERLIVGNASISTVAYDARTGECTLLCLDDRKHLLEK